MNPIQSIGVTLNPEKHRLIAHAKKIIAWLERHDITVLMSETTPLRRHFARYLVEIDELNNRADLIISLGGDGTLCRAARDYSSTQIPVLGINLGGLGFLTEVPLRAFEQGLQAVCSGAYSVEQRIMLETKILRENGPSKPYVALNDIVISKSSLPRVISLETFVSGDLVTTYAADGIIISTPTGSTAYSLSAGGPIVDPRLDVILLSPICAHTLSVRPLIVSGTERIEVVPEPPVEDILLTVDGQECHSLSPPDRIEIYKSSRVARLVRLQQKKSFFETLRTKLGWSGITAKDAQKHQ